VREEVTTLSQDMNYFMDPDRDCKPNSQADILYRHWVATLRVPSLGVDSSVDFYINADQGDKLNGNNVLNLLWENPGRPAIESDKFKVIIFDIEVKKTSGEWKKATRLLVDLRTPYEELPFNDKGELLCGFRKVNYKGHPAIEASFGYGYTDYVVDSDPNNYESSDATKAVIDLQYPAPDASAPLISNVCHAPQNPKPLEPVTVTSTITDAESGVYSATLHYSVNDAEEESVLMTQDGATFTATIPGQDAGTKVEYCISAIDNAANIKLSPTYQYTVKASSQISCQLPSKVTYSITPSVTIGGSITPAHSDISVTIYYSTDGTSWNTMTAVTTDSEGCYSYTWTPPSAGTYYIKASWPGDYDHNGATSATVPVTFEDYTWLMIVAIVAIVGGVAVYFLKIRKKHQKLK